MLLSFPFPEHYYYKFKQYITDRASVIIGLSIRKFVLIFFTSIVNRYFNEGVLRTVLTFCTVAIGTICIYRYRYI